MAVPSTLPFLALLGLSLLVSCASSRRLAEYELSGPSGSIGSTVSLVDPRGGGTAKKVSKEVVLINTPSNLYIEDTPTTVGSQTLFYNADGGTYEQKLVLANVDAEDPPVLQIIDDVSSGSKFSQTATQIGSQDSTSIQEIINDGDNSQAVQGQNIIGSTDALIDQFIRNTEEGNGSEFSQTATQIGTEGSNSGQFVDNDASNTDNSQTQLILGSTDTEVVQDIENNQVGGEDAVNIQDATSIDDTNQLIEQQLINGVPPPPPAPIGK